MGPYWAYWHVELIDRFVTILTQRGTCRDLDESQNLTTAVWNDINHHPTLILGLTGNLICRTMLLMLMHRL